MLKVKYFSGVCVSPQGYWGDPNRTVERFVDWNGSTSYRTGDCGRWYKYIGASDGRIVFLGRKDRIVKNRWFLVNLETEVDEAVLGTEIAAIFGVSGAYTVMMERARP